MRTALVLLSAAVVGCAAPRDAAAYGPDARPSALSYQAAADSLERAPSTPARLAVAARALEAAGLTPLAAPLLSTVERRFTLEGAGGPVVVGLVPGRNPLLRSELVVLAVAVDAPEAPAVLEAARTLVERSAWTGVPQRTVQVSMWAGPASRARALASPLWPADRVHAVLGVEGAVWDEAPVDDGVGVVGGAPGLDLAALVLARVLEAASEPRALDSVPVPASRTPASRTP